MLNVENLKKVQYYIERNGVWNTFLQILEKCVVKQEEYHYVNPPEETLEKQRQTEFEFPCKFSITVPAYETKEAYLRAMIDSVLAQTYTNFELIIADASRTEHVEKVVKTYDDKRIVYKPLEENGGISENTNAALEEAGGDYVGLLDHDDVLTPDALYEMAKAIEKGKKDGKEYVLLYSDEDKCDGSGTVFSTPHRKDDFNLDLFVSNNYICHFTVIKTGVIKRMKFRKEYDGAQDYDLFLRIAGESLLEKGYEKTLSETICHVPKILYHWRCHEDSTAANPQSKEYAYKAGQRASSEFTKQMRWKTYVLPMTHMGFYEMLFDDEFTDIGNVGASGGRIVNRKNRVIGGMRKDGKVCFEGLKEYFGGYMHRAHLQQTAETLDLRCMRVRQELQPLFEEITGMKYIEKRKDKLFFREKYRKTEEEWLRLSEAFCEEVKKRGYRLFYFPDYVYKNRRG